jgi:hypothetical protein
MAVSQYVASWEKEFSFKPNLNRARTDWLTQRVRLMPQPDRRDVTAERTYSPFRTSRSSSCSKHRQSQGPSRDVSRSHSRLRSRDLPQKGSSVHGEVTAAEAESYDGEGFFEDGDYFSVKRNSQGSRESRFKVVETEAYNASGIVPRELRPRSRGREHERQRTVRSVLGKAVQEELQSPNYDRRYRHPGQRLSSPSVGVDVKGRSNYRHRSKDAVDSQKDASEVPQATDRELTNHSQNPQCPHLRDDSFVDDRRLMKESQKNSMLSNDVAEVFYATHNFSDDRKSMDAHHSNQQLPMNFCGKCGSSIRDCIGDCGSSEKIIRSTTTGAPADSVRPSGTSGGLLRLPDPTETEMPRHSMGDNTTDARQFRSHDDRSTRYPTSLWGDPKTPTEDPETRRFGPQVPAFASPLLTDGWSRGAEDVDCAKCPSCGSARKISKVLETQMSLHNRSSRHVIREWFDGATGPVVVAHSQENQGNGKFLSPTRPHESTRATNAGVLDFSAGTLIQHHHYYGGSGQQFPAILSPLHQPHASQVYAPRIDELRPVAAIPYARSAAETPPTPLARYIPSHHAIDCGRATCSPHRPDSCDREVFASFATASVANPSSRGAVHGSVVSTRYIKTPDRSQAHTL